MIMYVTFSPSRLIVGAHGFIYEFHFMSKDTLLKGTEHCVNTLFLIQQTEKRLTRSSGGIEDDTIIIESALVK